MKLLKQLHESYFHNEELSPENEKVLRDTIEHLLDQATAAANQQWVPGSKIEEVYVYPWKLANIIDDIIPFFPLSNSQVGAFITKHYGKQLANINAKIEELARQHEQNVKSAKRIRTAHSKDQVETWLRAHDMTHFRINDDLTVDVNSDVSIQVNTIPIKFNRIYGNFEMENCKSLKGGPKRVDGQVRITFTGEDHLTKPPFQDLPAYVGGSLCMTGISTLHNINNYVKRASGVEVIVKQGKRHVTNVLGLLQIKGLVWVTFVPHDAATIVRKHLDTDKDIFACQEDLIEAGFVEQAKL